MNGILIVNKPIGKTSFDIIRDVRKEYNTKKVGHIGTLDPMASGVLPVLIGKATRLSDYFMNHDKEYISILKLGQKTDTGDSEGNVIEKCDVSDSIYESNCLIENNVEIIHYTFIEKVLNSFLGEINQIPPMYSAIKINGKKLYEIAREGKEIERLPRKVFINSIELIDVNKNNNEITFKVVCSKGTYIRTLCEDIAYKFGTCGYMKELERTRVGNFKIEDANKFIELKDVFSNAPRIDLNANDLKKVENGIKLPINNNKDNDNDKFQFVNLYHNNEFYGIGKIENNYYKRFIII